MKKIMSLTHEQQESIPEFVEKWIGIGLSTDPIDTDKVIPLIRKLYALAGLEIPKGIFVVPSAFVGAYAAPISANFISIIRGSAVRSAVYSAVRSAVRSAKLWWHYWYGGSLWISFPAYFIFMQKIGVEIPEIGMVYAELCQSAGYMWLNKDFAFVSERPVVIHRDNEGRLHNEHEMSLSYSDGWGIYNWHGVAVTKQIIEHPETITIEQIEKESNAEVRRIMCERYGWQRYYHDCGAKEIDRDPRFGVLYRKEMPDDETLVFVDVENSTPESDGTNKHYILRVEPNAYGGDASRYAHAAVASTWRRKTDNRLLFKNWRDYNPLYES